MGALPLAVLKSRGDRAALKKELVAAHAKALHHYFDALHTDVMAGLGSKAATAPFDQAKWDANLKQVLLALGKTTAQAMGDSTAGALGGQFDLANVEAWLEKNADIGSSNINATTADTLAQMMSYDFEDDAARNDAVDAAFDDGGELFARADEIASSTVTSVGEFASLDSAKQNDAATKTWTVNSPNPRPSHAAVDGESVGVDELFSNGMAYPGDWSGGADEVAGCECTVDYSKDG